MFDVYVRTKLRKCVIMKGAQAWSDENHDDKFLLHMQSLYEPL